LPPSGRSSTVSRGPPRSTRYSSTTPPHTGRSAGQYPCPGSPAAGAATPDSCPRRSPECLCTTPSSMNCPGSSGDFVQATSRTEAAVGRCSR
jgi:hypothetical protein